MRSALVALGSPKRLLHGNTVSYHMTSGSDEGAEACRDGTTPSRPNTVSVYLMGTSSPTPSGMYPLALVKGLAIKLRKP